MILIYKKTGDSFMTPRQVTYSYFGMILIGCVISFFIVTRFGRRTLLMTGFSLSSVILVLAGGGVYFNQSNFVTVMILLFGTVGGSTTAPVFMTHVVETNPDVVIGVVSCLASGFLLLNTLITFPLIAVFGPAGYLFILATVSFIGVFYMALVVKESKGLTDK